jgi:hypothetical protein
LNEINLIKFDKKENARIWSNLVNHLINSNQIIHIPTLIQQISVKLKNKAHLYKTSRDWLMWFFLLISGFVYRNCTAELAELYECLYKDEEPLPNPDMSSFLSVVKLAPLSIWIHLNQKSINPSGQNDSAAISLGAGAAGVQSAANKSPRSLIVPDMLRNHYALIQNCLSTTNFQDFRLSVCLNACKLTRKKKRSL